MLLHLPPMPGHGKQHQVHNGPPSPAMAPKTYEQRLIC